MENNEENKKRKVLTIETKIETTNKYYESITTSHLAKDYNYSMKFIFVFFSFSPIVFNLNSI